jgi:hypothetical protein
MERGVTNHRPADGPTDETSKAERISGLVHMCDLEAQHITYLRTKVRELIAERDEARRELCEFAVGWKRAGMRVQHPQQYAQERGWDCCKNSPLDSLAKIDEECGLQ